MEYIRKKEFFVGVDSDGTAFDTMTIKHTHAFIPCMIKIWGMEAYEKSVYKAAEYINLFSKTRGINRFPGLIMTFDMLKEELGESFNIGNYEALRTYCQSGAPLSNNGLSEYVKKHPDVFLEQTLKWSCISDIEFSKKAHGLPPFENVADTIGLMHRKADIMVVSAASAKGLRDDWGEAGLLEKVDYVAGQEEGPKAKQISCAMSSGYLPQNGLMIGDGDGDRKAAKANGICFYPIIPKKEAESWRLLREKYFAMFLNGTYKGETEEKLCDTFYNSLS